MAKESNATSEIDSNLEHIERKTKVYIACSHVRHMYCHMSHLWYQFTGRGHS